MVAVRASVHAAHKRLESRIALRQQSDGISNLFAVGKISIIVYLEFFKIQIIRKYSGICIEK